MDETRRAATHADTYRVSTSRIVRARFAVALAVAVFVQPSAIGAADPYDIDVMVPQTGALTFFGQAFTDGLKTTERVINASGGIRGRPVRFVLYDDQSSPAIAVQLATQIMTKKPLIILGPALASQCLAVAPLFRGGPVNYCFSPVVRPPAGGFVFAAGVSTSDHAVALLRYFHARSWKSIALITATDSSGIDADAEYERQLALPENRGLTLSAHEHFSNPDLSVAAQMARIKATNPDVLICYAAGTPLGTLLRGVQQAGLDIPIVTSDANMTYSQMRQYSDIMPKVLLFAGAPVLANQARSRRGRAQVDQFYRAFRETGTKPDLFYTFAWDQPFMVVEALRALRADVTAEQLRSYIVNRRDFAGVMGDYDFRGGNQHGLGVDDIMIERWDPASATFVAVSDFGGNLGRR